LSHLPNATSTQQQYVDQNVGRDILEKFLQLHKWVAG